MPHTYIHRHEKPPIPWTSISMSKKREAVQEHERGRGFVMRDGAAVGYYAGA